MPVNVAECGAGRWSGTTAADFGRFITASLRCDDNVDGKMFGAAGQLVFQSTRIADAAFRVIDKAQQLGAPSSSSIALCVSANLLRQILSAESCPRFLDHNGKAIMVEEEGGARHAIAVSRCPFIRADVLEMLPEECVNEVLYVYLILDTEGRSILAAQSQLTGHRMKTLAKVFGHGEIIDIGTGGGACGRCRRWRWRRRNG